MTNTLSRYTILDISIKGHLEIVHCVSLAPFALSLLEFLGLKVLEGRDGWRMRGRDYITDCGVVAADKDKG